jgi:hypothetical protein
MNWRFFPLLVVLAGNLGSTGLPDAIVEFPARGQLQTQTHIHDGYPNSGRLRTPAHAPMSSKNKYNLQDEEPSRKLRATSHVGYTARRALSLSSKADLSDPTTAQRRRLDVALDSVGNNGNCDNGGDDCFPLKNCQGDCDNDAECEVC